MVFSYKSISIYTHIDDFMTPNQKTASEYNWRIHLVKGSCANLRRLIYMSLGSSDAVTYLQKDISKLERLLVRTLISQRDTTIQQQSNRNGQVPNNPTRTK